MFHFFFLFEDAVESAPWVKNVAFAAGGVTCFVVALLLLAWFMVKNRAKIPSFDPDNKKIIELIGITLLLEVCLGTGVAFFAESIHNEHTKVILLLVIISIFVGLIIGLILKLIIFIYEIKESFREYTSKTDSEITWQFHEKTIKHLKDLAHSDFKSDPIFKELINERFQDFYSDLYEYSRGQFRFNAESFKIYWEKLILSDEVDFYYSTALVNSPFYWRDGTGTKATKFTVDISNRKTVEKVFIIKDDLWDNKDIRDWIVDQKNNGSMKVSVVKESSIDNADVVYDFGVYGNRAVGYQELLDIGQGKFRMKYTLYFDKPTIQKTQKRFEDLTRVYVAHDTEEYFPEDSDTELSVLVTGDLESRHAALEPINVPSHNSPVNGKPLRNPTVRTTKSKVETNSKHEEEVLKPENT